MSVLIHYARLAVQSRFGPGRSPGNTACQFQEQNCSAEAEGKEVRLLCRRHPPPRAKGAWYTKLRTVQGEAVLVGTFEFVRPLRLRAGRSCLELRCSILAT